MIGTFCACCACVSVDCANVLARPAMNVRRLMPSPKPQVPSYLLNLYCGRGGDGHVDRSQTARPFWSNPGLRCAHQTRSKCLC